MKDLKVYLYSYPSSRVGGLMYINIFQYGGEVYGISHGKDGKNICKLTDPETLLGFIRNEGNRELSNVPEDLQEKISDFLDNVFKTEDTELFNKYFKDIWNSISELKINLFLI